MNASEAVDGNSGEQNGQTNLNEFEDSLESLKLSEMLPQPWGNKQFDLKLLQNSDDWESIKSQCSDRPLFILFWAQWDKDSSKLKELLE